MHTTTLLKSVYPVETLAVTSVYFHTTHIYVPDTCHLNMLHTPNPKFALTKYQMPIWDVEKEGILPIEIKQLELHKHNEDKLYRYWLIVQNSTNKRVINFKHWPWLQRTCGAAPIKIILANLLNHRKILLFTLTVIFWAGMLPHL